MMQEEKSEKNLADMRHSLAHVLAMAVRDMYPGVKLGIGPAIEHGFYYDFEFPAGNAPSDKDLKAIEKTMRKILGKGFSTTGKDITLADARVLFADEPYKLELAGEFASEGKKLTAYTSGDFTDLCKGGHVAESAEIPADGFTLTHIAGAYWRGDAKNQMLTRIYGLAFENKEMLQAHITQQEEAKKRDHRKLGKELELFTIIDEVGAGLPLFYPKGALLRRTIENYIGDMQEARGYTPIWIPHITKSDLYKISGHLEKYDAMYAPMTIDGDEYYLKPMNCPHFMMLYKTLPHSYKELPLRYTATTTNYRYEKSGELSGLTRVRALTQDDCHVFCAPDDIEREISLMLDMIKEAYQKFGFTDFWVRVSLRDPKNKAGYIGADEVWEKAENALRTTVVKAGFTRKEAEGEAAFYGPKLDFMMKDAIGRQWQLSTIQLDFILPERFDLEYTGNDGAKKRPVVIHRAILGSTERFMGILIEHYAGAFPAWLAPVQVKILPIGEAHKEYARAVHDTLRNLGVRAELDASEESLGKKIRNGKMQKVPFLAVIGDKEKESGTITLESREKGNLGAHSVEDATKIILS